MKTPWAVLLLKFSDQNSEPFTASHARSMFTPAGLGTGNAVEYFRDVSHGHLDLGGSTVFGWFLMTHSKADLDAYRNEKVAEDTKNGTSLANGLTRQRIIDWGTEAAGEHDVDLSKFFATLYVFSQPVDYFGRGGAAVVNFNPADAQQFSVDLTGVSHEMGHGHGLTHSRREGSTAEYADAWDIMSAYVVHEARNDSVPPSVARPYQTFGPGLNAANMDIMGWLDETRVWSPPQPGTFLVTLRPLHRRDLPGTLAVRARSVYVEFRSKSRWDAAIPASCVLLHRQGVHPASARTCSYLITRPATVLVGSGASSQLTDGDSWEQGSESNIFEDFLRITVRRIDAAAEEAYVEISWRAARPVPRAGPGRLFGGVASDGGGLIWVPGRGFVRIPPHSPLLHVLSKVAEFQSLQGVRLQGSNLDRLSTEVLMQVRDQVDAIVSARNEFHVPAQAPRRQSLFGHHAKEETVARTARQKARRRAPAARRRK